MLRKLSTAWYLLRTKGLSGVAAKIRGVFIGWWTSDHWWVGRIVELRGNMEVVDGCRFDLSNPVIGTPQKAGFLIGNYENGERAALSYIPADTDLPIIEVGGSIGVMACVSSKHFGNPEQHIVVEANPNLIPVLTHNRDLNGCRFQIVHSALAYGTPFIPFHVHPKFVVSSIHQVNGYAQAVDVPTITIGNIVQQHHFANPIVLFCDVEGAETGLFANETDLLRERVKYLCIEFHPRLTGRQHVDEMMQQLSMMGFQQLYHHKDNYLYLNESL